MVSNKSILYVYMVEKGHKTKVKHIHIAYFTSNTRIRR